MKTKNTFPNKMPDNFSNNYSNNYITKFSFFLSIHYILNITK